MTSGTVWIYTEGYRGGAARLLRAAEANEIVQAGAVALQVNGTDAVWSRLRPPQRPDDLPPQFLLAMARALQGARWASEADGRDRVVTARHSDTDGWQWQVYRLDEVPDPPAKPLPPASLPRRSPSGPPAPTAPDGHGTDSTA
ncbi:hypothetical protein PUR49_07955 [Streptomyces sp. BE147]|uniref:hypothetical protein n=1 Tax=Streptomyces sp. BE147 TaxID=3002524 RepID=UPI002E7685F1|nr:hypothetical protein [Streptomyces sp. BE147]MEE1736432.1 hypothetical protein [Streptomyces sp. BE147]